MRRIGSTVFSFLLLAVVGGAVSSWAQDATAVPATAAMATVVPHVVQYSGTVAGVTASGPVTLRFALYAAATGGEPVWAEAQTVTVDAKGRYVALLGSTLPAGIPQSVFSSGEAKWLGVTMGEEAELARTVLVATPYSLKASDAETVGGHAPGDFLLAPKDANGKPETGTAVTQINTSQGILGGGTGPTINLTLDATYFQELAAAFAIKGSANTFTATNTFNVPVVFPTSQTFPGTASLTAANVYKVSQFLGATGTATKTAGFKSSALIFQGSAFNSTASTAEAINFAWESEPTANDTASPAGTMNLLYSTGTNAPAETGLSIGSTGKLTFASGQTFPGTGAGTITGITTSSPLTGSGTSGSVALGVSTTGLETALGTYYAKTGAANTFTGNQTITGTETATASSTTSVLSGTDTNTSSGEGVLGSGFTGVAGTGNATTGTGVKGSGLFGLNGTGSPSLIGTVGNYSTYGIGSYSTGVFGVYGESFYTGSTDNPIGVFGYTPSTVTGSVANGVQPIGVLGRTDGMNSAGGIFLATAGDVNSLGLEASGYTGAEIFGDSLGLSASGATGINASGSNGEGVFGTTSATGGPAGIYGQSTATTIGSDNYPGIGISGNASGPSSWGVYGNSTDTNGIGVYGNLTGNGDGVRGTNDSAGGIGVHAIGVTPSSLGAVYGASGQGYALWADNGANIDTTDTYGVLLSTGDNNQAGVFVNDSANYATLFVGNASSGGSGLSVPLMTLKGKDGACGFSGAGDVTCSGRLKTAVAVAGSETKVEVYSVQSSENWFEDFGTAKLENGHVSVGIDPQFAKIVNTGVPYHVFLTPAGNCKGLYVARRSADGFEVRELGDGGSSVEFDYRIVAKRTGHETERMADVTAEMTRMTNGNPAKLGRAKHAVPHVTMPTAPYVPAARPVQHDPREHKQGLPTRPGTVRQASLAGHAEELDKR
jgi:hypothetical protein